MEATVWDLGSGDKGGSIGKEVRNGMETVDM